MMVGNNLKDTQLQQIVDKTILLYDKVILLLPLKRLFIIPEIIVGLINVLESLY